MTDPGPTQGPAPRVRGNPGGQAASRSRDPSARAGRRHRPGRGGSFSQNGNGEMTGRDGHRSPALPRDRVAALFRDRRG